MITNQIRQSLAPGYKGVSFSVGPSSWRSGSSDSSSSSSWSSGWHSSSSGTSIHNYSGSSDSSALWYMLGSMNGSSNQYSDYRNSYDIFKEQKELAKDKLFLDQNPEVKQKLHFNRRLITWGTVGTVLSAFLTQGIEITKKARKDFNVNFDPMLLALSIGIGLLCTGAASIINKNKLRTQRLMQEKSKDDT